MNDKELLEFLEEHCLNSCPCAAELRRARYCCLCDINQKIIEIRSRKEDVKDER